MFMTQPEDAMTPNEMRWLRQRAGISQSMFAGWLGIDKNTVARMERGEIQIRIPIARLTLYVLAALFERTIDEYRKALARHRRTQATTVGGRARKKTKGTTQR